MTAPGAKPRGALWRGLAVVVAAIVALAALVVYLNLRGEAPLDEALSSEGSPGESSSTGGAPIAASASAATIERGAYLARVGNCVGCHTAVGGAEYAGGRGIETPFGLVYAPNLTPDPETGIGRWSSAEFWRAMHNGRSKDGRLLYPVFPYPNYTQMTREDSDAIHAYLASLPAVARQNRPHALRFPYDLQASLAVWRALFFRPAAFEPEPGQSAEWNRGAYLVRSLGHCGACHSPRNFLGSVAPANEFTGGPLPRGGWYAPSLRAADEAGVAHWQIGDIVALLETGHAPNASTLGPMAEVVFRSTQYIDDADLRAMALFLKSLPADRMFAESDQADAADAGDAGTNGTRADGAVAPVLAPGLARGREVYEVQCAQCHGERGEGAPGAYAALAGNRAVTLESPANVIRIVLDGGFTPSTAGNPRPYGMPPFAQALDDADVAAVVSYIRNDWGNLASRVTALDVMRYR